MRIFFPRVDGYLTGECFANIFDAFADAMSNCDAMRIYDGCQSIKQQPTMTTVEVIGLPATAKSVWVITGGGLDGEIVGIYTSQAEAESIADQLWDYEIPAGYASGGSWYECYEWIIH